MKSIFVLLCFVSLSFSLDLIPRPQEIESRTGEFIINSNTKIVADSSLIKDARMLARLLEPATGYTFEIAAESDSDNAFHLDVDSGILDGKAEAYILDVSEQGVKITAVDQAGLFRAFQTLRQMLPAAILRDAPVKNQKWSLPAVVIKDWPRFQWRGLMIDCSRTFWHPKVLKKYIEALAFYKMNVLHLHLTDDQGWRLEINRYPQLTEKAAQFAPEFDEPPERQGFYSQEDIRELVAFAAERDITIVPEIEMPGHSAEVFAAFPNLSCEGKLFKIHPFGKGPGIHREILCAGNDSTFDFLYGVLDEVVDLFPSPYIHIGGDEAPKDNWQACPQCQARIKSERLKDEEELQSWFVRKIEKFLNSRGKNLIGWNEILQGGLAPNAAVMFWHGDLESTLAAAREGHKIVMTPTSHCYFDYSYERTPTEKVYGFDPVPDNLGSEYHGFILGVQANFWSHIDRTVPRMDRQIFPRLLALSEVGWSEKEKSWKDFAARLNSHFKRLDIMGVYYHSEEK